MTKLGSLASLVRSKNAGPFHLTFDIMFADAERYKHVRDAGVLGPSLFAELFRVDVAKVVYIEHHRALAFKVTIPRPRVQGDRGETDTFGGQQFDGLFDIEIPDQ